MTREEKRKTGDAVMSLVHALLIKFALLLIIFHASFLFNLRSPVGDFYKKFSRQIFFPLAMATKMVAAWSAGV